MPGRTKAMLGRRQFLSVGTTVAATALWRESSAEATPRTPYDKPWIPSKEFLADLPRLMEVASLPGLAMATVEKGEVVWTRAVGVTNAETRAPMQEDSIFEAASMSKPVFAYVVLRLADEKQIDLDRPLVQYRRPDYLSNHPDIDLITARHVLCHATGLPNWRTRPEEKLTPAFKPGSRWRYSGEGFFWLQLVVEQITGQGVDMVMRSRLFDPAKMPLSTFGWNADLARLSVYGHKEPEDDEVKPGFQAKREMGERFLSIAAKWGKPISAWTYEDVCRASPEARDLPGSHPLPADMAKAPIDYFKLPVNVFPNVAGMLSTTVSEYARFMTLMLDHPKHASWEIAETNRQAMLSRVRMLKANAIYWGLGWELEQSPSGLLFCHGGNNGGQFKTYGVGDPVRRRAIVIFTNGGHGDRVNERIIRAATGYDMLAFI
jgi:CubicO group peptidase (beta-lactamase class C family)